LFSWVAIGAGERPNVAVLPFSGEKSVTPEQLNFITGKFAAELATTGQFEILDRSRMDFILQEQGFQQSGACDGAECRMQLGQMLGVDHVVSGTLVRFDETYAFRADYVDVASGRVEHSVEQSQKGELSSVYAKICKTSAQELSSKVASPLSVTAPIAPQAAVSTGLPETEHSGMSTKRKIALGLWGGSLLGAGGALYYNSQATAAQDDYDAAWESYDQLKTRKAYADLQDAESSRNISVGVSAGTVLIGALLWFWPE